MSNTIVAVGDSVYKNYIENIVCKIDHEDRKNNIKKKIVVIQNGINREKILTSINLLQKKEVGIKQTDFVFGTVGRLEPIKSCDVFVKAFGIFIKYNPEKHKDVKLVLIGDGSQKKMLQQLILRLRIQEKVLMLGMQDDVYKFYNLFDCFVLSSQSEGLSVALLEACVVGLPIITTNIGKQHDVISDNVNGLLVEPNDPNLLFAAMKKIYENKSLRKSMQNANKELVEKKFDISKTVVNYEHLYESIVTK